MRLFSNRKRPAAAGPLPWDRLPRTDTPSTVPALPDPPTAEAPGPASFTPVVGPIAEVFAACRTAEVAPSEAPMPSPEAAVDNLKGYCFFLDADLVGITEVPDNAWRGAPLEGHTHAVSILVAHRRAIRAGEPGHDWIRGGAQIAAEMRAMEIATVVARYLGALGHAATAHAAPGYHPDASDVHHDRVAWAAGVVEAGRGALTNPLVAGGYGLATITTSFDLPTDGRLAPRNRV